MNNIDRLFLELNNKNYLPQEQLKILLAENSLKADEEYTPKNKKALLYTVLSILEILANDIDLFRKIETEFTTTDAAFDALSQRIRKIKDTIPALNDKGENSNNSVSFLFTGG